MQDDFSKLKEGYLKKSGWIESQSQQIPLDEYGNYLPWYSYAMIDFLTERLDKNMNIFEFGCGYSTLFYAARCNAVTAAETRQEWLEKILSIAKNKSLQNLKIYHKVGKEFTQSVNKINDLFDLIAIDSIDRLNCAYESLPKLKEGGCVLLDNSNREQYGAIFTLMHEMGFKFINFSGLGPLRNDSTQSTLFYKRDNVFFL